MSNARNADGRPVTDPGVPKVESGSTERKARRGKARQTGATRMIGEEPAPPARVKVDVARACLTIDVRLNRSDDYAVEHLETQRLSRRQRDAARSIFDGLRASGAKLSDGKDITRPSDIVRYILDRTADILEEART